jgi:hypothetical protein
VGAFTAKAPCREQDWVSGMRTNQYLAVLIICVLVSAYLWAGPAITATATVTEEGSLFSMNNNTDSAFEQVAENEMSRAGNTLAAAAMKHSMHAKPSKPRFNYFVGLKLASSPPFVSAVDTLKAELLTRNPNYKDIFTSTEKMHLTLMLAALEDEHAVETTRQALLSCGEEWCRSLEATNHNSTNAAATLKLERLGTFGQNVLWLAPTPGPVLGTVESVTRLLHTKLLAAGIASNRVEVSDTLHATIAKTNFKSKKHMKVRKADTVGLSSFPFGPVEETNETEAAVVVPSGDPNFVVDVSQWSLPVACLQIDLMRIGSTDPISRYYQSFATITPSGPVSSATAEAAMSAAVQYAEEVDGYMLVTPEGSTEVVQKVAAGLREGVRVESKKRAKPRYNYFVGLKLGSPTFDRAVDALKVELVNRSDDYRRIFTPTAKMHLTLLLASLEDEASVEAARQALLSCAEEWYQSVQQLQMTTAGDDSTNRIQMDQLGVFGQNVLWLAPTPGALLATAQAVTQSLHAKMLAAGVDAHNLEVSDTLHATIAKTNIKARKHIKVRKADTVGLTCFGTEKVIVDAAESSSPSTGAHCSWFVPAEFLQIDLMRIGSTDPRTHYYQSLATITPLLASGISNNGSITTVVRDMELNGGDDDEDD